MNKPSAGQHDESGHYEIRLRGHLAPRWSAWFDGMTLTAEADGTTVVRGPVVDQAALQGLLRKVNDMGVQLVSVTPVQPDDHDTASISPR